MQFLNKVILVVNSKLRIIIKRLNGNSISVQRLPIIHSSVIMQTKKKGDFIRLGDTCQIKPNTELSTDGGTIA